MRGVKRSRMMRDLRIESATSSTLDEALDFIAGWTRDDIYARFGFPGDGGPNFLRQRLRAQSPALLGRISGRIVALLDHCVDERTVHFGIVVGAPHRRQHVGRSLVERLIAINDPRLGVAAQCSFSNAAAVGLLRSCGFTRTRVDGGEVLWRYR